MQYNEEFWNKYADENESRYNEEFSKYVKKKQKRLRKRFKTTSKLIPKNFDF